MIVAFCLIFLTPLYPPYPTSMQQQRKAAGQWFGTAARTQRNFFHSVTADVGVSVGVATTVAVAIGAVATTVGVAIDAVATAVTVAMIVAVVAMIVTVAMAVVAVVAKAEDIAFVG